MTSENPASRWQNLPLWARQEASDLRREVGRLKRVNNMLRGISDQEASGKVSLVGFDGKEVVVDDSARMRFRFGRSGIDFIEVGLSRGKVQVRGGFSISVSPEAANSLTVSLRDLKKSCD